MNIHPTKYVGDVAVAKIISDLTVKRWFVFIPAITEHCRTDIIAYKQKKTKVKVVRIQCKYGNVIPTATYSEVNEKMYCFPYEQNDFDYYAMYIPQVDAVCYVPLEMVLKIGSMTIRYELPTNATPCWWYEDFLTLSKKEKVKRNYKDFGIKLNFSKFIAAAEPYRQDKFKHPTKNKLQELIWKLPYIKIGLKFGVSDTAIRKLVKKYKLIAPPMGFFLMSLDKQLSTMKDYYLQSSDNEFKSILKRIKKQLK